MFLLRISYYCRQQTLLKVRQDTIIFLLCWFCHVIFFSLLAPIFKIFQRKNKYTCCQETMRSFRKFLKRWHHTLKFSIVLWQKIFKKKKSILKYVDFSIWTFVYRNLFLWQKSSKLFFLFVLVFLLLSFRWW